jgi:hypothetical protein
MNISSTSETTQSTKSKSKGEALRNTVIGASDVKDLSKRIEDANEYEGDREAIPLRDDRFGRYLFSCSKCSDCVQEKDNHSNSSCGFHSHLKDMGNIAASKSAVISNLPGGPPSLFSKRAPVWSTMVIRKTAFVNRAFASYFNFQR